MLSGAVNIMVKNRNNLRSKSENHDNILLDYINNEKTTRMCVTYYITKHLQIHCLICKQLTKKTDQFIILTYFYFTDEKTKAQIHYVICIRQHRQHLTETGSDPKRKNVM